MAKHSNAVIAELPTERDDLSLHVDLCTERYHQLVSRLDLVDQRFDRLEHMLSEVRDSVTGNQNQTLNRYLLWAGSIITVLLGVISGLVIHLAAK